MRNPALIAALWAYPRRVSSVEALHRAAVPEIIERGRFAQHYNTMITTVKRLQEKRLLTRIADSPYYSMPRSLAEIQCSQATQHLLDRVTPSEGRS